MFAKVHAATTPPALPSQGNPQHSAAQKAMLEATLTNLRSKLVEIVKDNWLYEAPRYTYK